MNTLEIIANTADLLPIVSMEDRFIRSLTPTGQLLYKVCLAGWSGAPKVDWNGMVWNKKHVPRWAFIQWISILGRLYTKDRPAGWGIISESPSLVLLTCPFASYVWKWASVEMGGWSSRLGFFYWDYVRYSIFSTAKGEPWPRQFRSGLPASIYYIWKETLHLEGINGRIFRKIGVASVNLVSRIVEEIKSCTR